MYRLISLRYHFPNTRKKQRVLRTWVRVQRLRLRNIQLGARTAVVRRPTFGGMAIALPPSIPQAGYDNDREHKHTANHAPDNSACRCVLGSSQGCTSFLCGSCHTTQSQSGQIEGVMHTLKYAYYGRTLFRP